MTISECYAQFSGDYAGTIRRIPKESLLRKLLEKFSEDTGIAVLEKALREQDAETAFRAAHTLKGVALNLGFTKLGNDASALTEILRGGSFDGTHELYGSLCGEYDRIRSAIRNLD